MRTELTRKILVASIAGAALVGACSSAPEGVPSKPAVKPKSSVDPCAGSPPPPRSYVGPLKNARCEQEMFLTMAGIADDLGVKCNFCHVPKEGSTKTFEYDKMTPNKETAHWMSLTFMSGLKRKDGEPMDCGACHVDKSGKPSAKFLGEPRDLAWTVEWMTTVMANRFELADGSKLKCKHCHVGGWGTPQFVPKVIGKTDQVPHGPLPGESAPPAPTTPDVTPSEQAPPPASASSATPPG